MGNIELTAALTESPSTFMTHVLNGMAALLRYRLYGWVAKLSQIHSHIAFFFPGFLKTVDTIDQCPRLDTLGYS
jgi:hypothetical protein